MPRLAPACVVALALTVLVAADALAQSINVDLFPCQFALDNPGGGFPPVCDPFGFGSGTSALADADLDVPEAWTVTRGDFEVVVAVLSTGVDLDHPELMDRLLPGFNVVDPPPDNSADDSPLLGDGTAIAGIIGAKDNGKGITGVAPEVTILPIKIHNGTVTCAAAAAGVDRAVIEDVDIIFLDITDDLGQTVCTPLRDAIDDAEAADILVVVPAGDTNKDLDAVDSEPQTYPAPNILVVTALNFENQRLGNASVGMHRVETGAYGSQILVAKPVAGTGTEIKDYYGLKGSGTVYAAAHAAGVAALIQAAIIERDNDLDARATYLELKTALTGAGDVVAALNGNVIHNRKLNAKGALDWAVASVGSGENLWLCDDGVDNDGDGFVDWPADEGCLDVFPGWKEDPQCWDGVDNDGDGDIDYDAGGNGDAQCSSKYDDREANGCGIGFEIALVLVPLLVARRRRGRARRVVRIER